MARLLPCLLTVLALVPLAAADLLHRNWWDQGAHVQFYGGGVGVYDPGNPENACLVLRGADQEAQPVWFYYTGLPFRYFPYGAAGQVTPGTLDVPLQPPLDSCPGSGTPGQHAQWHGNEAGAGNAVFVRDLLGVGQIPDFWSIVLTYSYCTGDPGVTTGTEDGLPPAGFTALDVDCGDAGSHEVTPACPDLQWIHGFWWLALVEPVFLSDGPLCNSLVGLPAGDAVVESCLSVELFDSINGIWTVESDVDHFVVLRDGTMAQWATTPSNVSNLEANAGSC